MELYLWLKDLRYLYLCIYKNYLNYLFLTSGLKLVWFDVIKSSGCSKVGLKGSTNLFEFIRFLASSFKTSISLCSWWSTADNLFFFFCLKSLLLFSMFWLESIISEYLIALEGTGATPFCIGSLILWLYLWTGVLLNSLLLLPLLCLWKWLQMFWTL